ncbi:MAG: hypothetical protein MJ180_05860 [Candidatus Gastranaerophilales bacterium]|nr:hypothetical protein [Candidatus Gastranaerophilales bacterium]
MEWLKNKSIVIKIATSNKTTSTKARKIFCQLKNIIVHIIFKNNCAPKNNKGTIFDFVNPLFKNKIKDIAIVIYKIIHIGINIQSGGESHGEFKL